MKRILFFCTLIFCFSICACKKQNEGVTSENLTINTTAAVPFRAAITFVVPDANNIFENQPIKLVNDASGVVSYVWKVDNTVKYTEASPIISFQVHGIHRVTLVVTDAQGNTATSFADFNILCNFLGGNH